MNETKSANFWLRFLASTTDFSLFVLLHLYCLYLISQNSELDIFLYSLLLYLVFVVLSPLGFFYSILLTHYFGGTLGKLLTGIKIIGQSGQKLTFKRILFRQTVGYTFSSILFGLGFWAILKDEQKLAWHDKAVGSKVIIYKKWLWILSLVLIIVLGIINLYLLSATLTSLTSGPISKQLNLVENTLNEQKTATSSGQIQKTQIPKSKLN